MSDVDRASWSSAVDCAALFAVAPGALGGVVVRGPASAARDRWLALVRTWLPDTTPVRRIPLGIPDARLLGGLDLTATLRAGRPILERGVLAEADGGVLVLAMAERLSGALAGRLAGVLDSGEVMLERDGLTLRYPCRLGLVALDEGVVPEEQPPAALLDRLALRVDLGTTSSRAVSDPTYSTSAIEAARERFAGVRIEAVFIEALCATALALGVWSMRASVLACQVARAAAALAGRSTVDECDATLAGRLVLAPRATQIPEQDASAPQADATDDSPPQDFPEAPDPERNADASDSAPSPESDAPRDDSVAQQPEDVVLAATQAAIPPDLLAELTLLGGASRSRSSGRTGTAQMGGVRGRPIGARPGALTGKARLDVVETLRAAAPWQPLRRRQQASLGSERRGRVEVRREDFRIKRYVQKAQTTTIFVVDASGSAALHRLAETKGAVELLLAECYVRRDRVAVLGFRQSSAELLLAPTRSLVRAKRSLAGLRAGGGTPLACAFDSALALADGIRRRGETPVVVVLSDGRANIARDGTQGREAAEKDALQAAAAFRAQRYTALFIDTSPQPAALGGRIAAQLGARYFALPHADSRTLSEAVRGALA